MITSKASYDKKYELFKQLAIATQVRGRHATGFAYSDGTHERYYKYGEAADLFVQRAEFQAIGQDKPYMIIGHDRYATHGDPADNSTNHPFKSRTLQFIHNGGVRNYESLKAEYRTYTECDSEVILRILEKADRRVKGIQQVYKEVEGSMACALMDSRKLRMWLWRNHGNPIYLCYHQELNLLAFASTRDIFETACKAAGLKDGWSKGQYWNDDYILCVKYRPDDDRILRETVEVEHKHIDPAVVSGWDGETLTRYAKYYEARRNEGQGGGEDRQARRVKQHKACEEHKAKAAGFHQERRTARYYDSANGCWVF
jgi:predicted glutamine amidotransferase